MTMSAIYPFHSPAIDNNNTLSMVPVTAMRVHHDEILVGRRSIMQLLPSLSSSNTISANHDEILVGRQSIMQLSPSSPSSCSSTSMSSDSTVITEDCDKDDDYMSDITDVDFSSDMAGVDFTNDDGDHDTTELEAKASTPGTCLLRKEEEDQLADTLVPEATCNVPPQTTSVHYHISPRNNAGVFRSVPSDANTAAPKDCESSPLESCADRNEPCRFKSGSAAPVVHCLSMCHEQSASGDDAKRKQTLLGRAVFRLLRSFTSRRSIKQTSSLATDESTVERELV
jgi:hypothetical protein